MLEPTNQSLENSPHGVAARGFGQIFGIHPAIAFLTLIVDMMLFGAEVGSLGTSLPISCAAAVVLAIITFLAQRNWYGDDDKPAFIKALILGFLTAIPTALPAVIYVPSGVVGDAIADVREKVVEEGWFGRVVNERARSQAVTITGWPQAREAQPELGEHERDSAADIDMDR